jgi:predicted glycoside hydrolase/deacetylase ChbG (UPF0249 family)
MAATRYLIVNADDFGQSGAVNRGIITAHERGIVTSASLMVRWPAAAEAGAYARTHPKLSTGLHIDLGEWMLHGETWNPIYEVVPLDDHAAVTREVARQLEAFRKLTGSDPTHLDSHQHVHLREPGQSTLGELASSLGIPLRHFGGEIQYCGRFYGHDSDGSPLPEVLSVDGLIAILAALPPGISELACHPAAGEDLPTMYCKERVQELSILCDPRVVAALDDLQIALRSFHGLGAHP